MLGVATVCKVSDFGEHGGVLKVTRQNFRLAVSRTVSQAAAGKVSYEVRFRASSLHSVDWIMF
jgi:hypothetical protein